MAAALKLPPQLGPPDDAPDAPMPDIVDGTIKKWRTKEGAVIGVTGKLSTGEWVAMTPDEDLTVHAKRHDASLALTLAYMRRVR
jgi:hypothetical protein